MNKLLKRIDSNYTRDLVEKAKQYKFYLGGFLLLLFFIIGYKLFIEEQLKPIWKPVAPNLVFALHFENKAKDTLLQEQIVKILDENVFTTWDIFLASILQKQEVKPKETLVSMHTAFSTNPELLYNWYLDKNEFNALLKAIKQQGAIKSRQYREKTIFEVSATKTTFHFYLQEQVLTASTSALLLEASLRAVTDADYTISPKAVDLMHGQGMHLLLNSNAFAKAVNHIVDFSQDFFGTSSNKFIALHLEMNQAKLIAKPLVESSTESSTESSAEPFNNDSGLKEIQENFEGLIGTDEDILFYTNHSLKKSETSGVENQRVKLLEERFGFQLENLEKGLDDSYSRFVLRSENPQLPYQVIGIPIRDSIVVSNELIKLHPETKANSGFFHQIKQPNVPDLLVGMEVQGFPNTFYLLNDDILWLGNFSIPFHEISKLQKVVSTKQESRLFLRNQLLFYAKEPLNTIGKRFFENMESSSVVSDNNTFRFDFHFNSSAQKSKTLDTLFATSLTRPIGKQVFPVKNHNTQALEYVWQDSKTRLHLMSDTGALLWEKSVWYHSNSEIRQVDIYNNGKLQYAFVSDGRIHVYDRLGRSVNGFPRALPTYFEADFLLPLRWKNEKEQRFLVAGSLPGNASSSGGKLYLYNRYGGISRGWKPRNVEAPLACAPQLINYKGKNVLLALLKNGSFYALEKSGRMRKGFPLISNLICNDRFVVDKNEHVHFISEGGTLIKLDLEGNLLARSQVSPRTGNTTFQLIENQWQQGDFLIAVQKGKQLTIKDGALNSIFSYELESDNDYQFAYYSDGFANASIVAFSAKSKTSILLSKQGEPLISGLVSTEMMPVVSLDEQERWQLLVSQSGNIMKLIE